LLIISFPCNIWGHSGKDDYQRKFSLALHLTLFFAHYHLLQKNSLKGNDGKSLPFRLDFAWVFAWPAKRQAKQLAL
jgi:hypothetical protein